MYNAHVCTSSLKLHKVSYLIESLKESMRPCLIRGIYHSKFQALLADNESIQLFKDYKILTVIYLYVLEVIHYIKEYKSSVEQNVHVHDYNTSKKKNGFTCFAV
jgi:coenzyme F420-reducing hydrogenase beta subunit